MSPQQIGFRVGVSTPPAAARVIVIAAVNGLIFRGITPIPVYLQ
jgi:hypothetical protein